MIAVIRLARPHFLLGGFLLFALGAAFTGEIEVWGYALGQAMVTSIQLTAQLVNEYADETVDRAVRNRTWFSGGSGAISDGVVSTATALRMACGTTVIAAIAILAMAARQPVAAAIGMVALAVAWGYSIEPLRLLRRGFGEAVTTMVVAGGVPLVGVLATGGQPSTGLWWAIGILVPIHLAMMLVFELPDLETDAAAGKRVLAVRIGTTRARALAVCLMGASAVALALGIALEALPPRTVVATAAIVPAVATAIAARRARWQMATGGAVGTLVITATGLLVGVA